MTNKAKKNTKEGNYCLDLLNNLKEYIFHLIENPSIIIPTFLKTKNKATKMF
jgi:hypothetical protein